MFSRKPSTCRTFALIGAPSGLRHYEQDGDLDTNQDLPRCRRGWLGWALGIVCLYAAPAFVSAAESNQADFRAKELPPGVVYTNYQVAEGPWSIHVVQIQRTNATYGIHLRHAGGGVLGLSTLRAQITDAAAVVGEPIAAINGGFYQRDKVYAGAARGLQVREGELLSAPSGSATFWIDVLGEPHLEEVASQFEITWPDGRRTPFGLNGDRGTNGVALYTSAIGTSTLTTNGQELVLERQATGRWLPLRIGQTYSARVREIRDGGNTQLAQDDLVLSLSPAVMGKFQNIKTGDTLNIATATSPGVRGVRTALSGGPALVRAGKRVKIAAPASESYEFSSMLERHPRSAIGWNSGMRSWSVRCLPPKK